MKYRFTIKDIDKTQIDEVYTPDKLFSVLKKIWKERDYPISLMPDSALIKSGIKYDLQKDVKASYQPYAYPISKEWKECIYVDAFYDYEETSDE